MKKLLFLILLAIFFVEISQGQATVDFKFTTNGIAPIPAFTLNKPSGMVVLSANLTKNLKFEPVAGFDLTNGKLWFSDLWLRYDIPILEGLKTTLGFNFPSYFGEITKEGDNLLRCLNLQSKTKYALNESNSITFDYWYIVVMEAKNNVVGHYFSLVYDWEKKLKGGPLNST